VEIEGVLESFQSAVALALWAVWGPEPAECWGIRDSQGGGGGRSVCGRSIGRRRGWIPPLRILHSVPRLPLL